MAQPVYINEVDFGRPNNILGGYSYSHITNSASTTVFTGKGELYSVVVNKTVAGTVTIQDSGSTIAVLKASVAEGTYTYRVKINQRLVITPAATAGDYTIIFKKD